MSARPIAILWMRRNFSLTLGLLVVVGIVVASAVWFHAHEGDGRSDYEKVFGEEPVARSVSPTCFPRRPGERGIADLNGNPESHGAMVSGEPRRLLLCRYWGLNHGNRSLRLAKKKLVTDPATVRRIADGLNDLPPFPDGAIACPFDEGARTYALFAYPDDLPVVVELNFEGCPAATNGRSGVAGLEGPVERQIMGLIF